MKPATTTAPAAKPDKAARPGQAAPPQAATPKPAAQGPSQAGPPAYLQAKLVVSQPQDAAEREADQTARAVVQDLRPGAVPRPGQPGAPTRLFRQAQPRQPARPRQRPVQQAPAQQHAPLAVEDQVSARREATAGMPLPEPLRLQMEQRLGADLSAVRIHTDGEAAALCRRMNARAFTVGSDIYFAEGAWDPLGDTGIELLSHELTHVVQQGATTGPPQAAALQRDGFWDWLLGEPDAPSDPLAPQRARLAEADAWARGGPYPASPLSMVGASGTGGLDVQYRPEPANGHGELHVRHGVAVVFHPALVERGGTIVPEPTLPADDGRLAAVATRIDGLRPAPRSAALACFKWTADEHGPWIEHARNTVQAAWSGQHSFFLNQPQSNWLGAEVRVEIDIGERARAATDHTEVHTYKLPPGEVLLDYGIQSALLGGDSTRDPHDQSMRLGSGAFAPNPRSHLRRSVYFARGRSELTADAQARLDGWVMRYNGAPDHVAHQEVPIELVGHASASGTVDGNRRLAQERADTVRAYLAGHGFTRAATRITTVSRGADEADARHPRLDTDQRVDIVVGGGAPQVAGLHEFGHALGLDDEYADSATASAPATVADHDAWVRKMTRADGTHLPGAVRERNGGVMSSGNEVRPQHYAVFHHALEAITGRTPWSLGLTVPKWRVQLDCGVPAILNDRPPEAPTDPLGRVPVAV